MESMSKTFLAVGWSPKFWWSPERQRTLLMPEGRRAEEVALEGDPVPVAADHLQDGVEAHLFEEDSRRRCSTS